MDESVWNVMVARTHSPLVLGKTGLEAISVTATPLTIAFPVLPWLSVSVALVSKMP